MKKEYASPVYQAVGVNWSGVEGGSVESNVRDKSSLDKPPTPQNIVVADAPRTIRTRRRIKFSEPLEEQLGCAICCEQYDRTTIRAEKPVETEDVLTWISSSLQNNTNEVTMEEKHFFVNNILPLYDTNYTAYEESLRECVVQFVLREVAIRETTLLRIRSRQESLRHQQGLDLTQEKVCRTLLRHLSHHCAIVDRLDPWDSASIACRPVQQQYFGQLAPQPLCLSMH